MTFPGRQESFAYDVVFVLDRSASAGADTTKAMDDYISLLSDNGLTIKTGVVCFYYEAIVMKDLSTDEIDYESININTKEWGIAHDLEHRPYGTNLADGIATGKAMLDADTSITDPSHKYLIIISDGDAHVFNDANGKPAVVVDKGDGGKKAGPDAYKRKYGNWNPPQDWSAYLNGVAALIAQDGDRYYYTKEISYSNGYPNAESFIPADELDQHAVTSDVALYQAYQEYMSVIKAGYRTSPVSVPSSHDRYYGPSFMDYLNGGDHLALDELIETVFYVGSGSTVTDEMGSGTDSEGNEYNFDFINDLDRINVRLNGETLDKKENDDGSYSFGEEKFLLAYDEAKDSFTFTIGTNITVLDELQIIYDVQLTNPQTVPGAYEDLYTNTEAVLHPRDSRGKDKPDEKFPEPRLFYENPDIDKKILEDGELRTENDVNIGDTVTYKVPVTIPGNVFEVPIIVTDTIYQGLTLDLNSLEADQGVTGLSFEENTSEKKEGCKVYTVTIPKEVVKENAGKNITLTYTATLNDKAVIDGDGNPNTVRLNYNVDNAIHVKIQSPDHTVATNTHQVRISKVSDEGKPLSGVRFTLTNKDGKYYQSKNGSASVWTQTKTEFTTDADGNILFEGLDQGTYTLTETETPAGYMPLSGPVTIKVDESGAVEDTFADVKDIKLADGAVQITNRAGVALPSTGGMGTTVFYVIGGVLVVGAAGALLVLAGAAIKFRK